MSAPKITILVPTVGRMEYLPLTRKCIDAQTRKDFRVLVLDNASPPEARDYVASWARSDSRVEVLRVDERVPMFSNFNRGVRAVDSEIFTFFHDDDEYLPEYLEVLAGALDRWPQAAFSGSNYDFIDLTGKTTERRRWIRANEVWDHRRYMRELIGRGRNPLAMPGLVFRRRAFSREGFDETLPIHFGDFVLLMRAAEAGGVAVMIDPVARIRKHTAQASAMPVAQSVPMRTELLAAYLDEYAERYPDDEALVASLRRRLDLAHRLGLVWGWLVDARLDDRRACLEALGDAPTDAVLRRALSWADRRGLRPERVSGRVIGAARGAANLLRF